MNDFQLLQKYASYGSEDAFRQLVDRYVNLVYSAALRQIHHEPAAEEIVQTVFLLLAKKAPAISHKTILSAWLFRTTRFVARRAARSDQRRGRYEREAAQMQIISNAEESWQRVAPLLDEAIARLNDTDRAAVLLRFFEKKTFPQIGGVLGISEGAAQKRVERAIEKLRPFFARQGFTVTGAALGGLLFSKSVEAAPVAVSSSLASLVFAKCAAGGGGLPALAALGLRDMLLSKWRVAGTWAAASVGLALLALLAVQAFLAPQSNTNFEGAATLAATGDVSRKTGMANAPSQTDAPNRQREIRLRVVDAHSLVGLAARVVVSFDMFEASTRLVTDADGAVTVVLPAGRFPGMLVSITAEGYAPQMRNWNAWEGKSLPLEETIKVHPSAVITGVVQDESGKPIEGAEFLNGMAGISLALRGHSYDSSLATATSDATGQWTFRQVPKDAEKATLVVLHPDFMRTRVTLPVSNAAPAVVVMSRGVSLAGQVVTRDGEPIPNANIEEAKLNEAEETDRLTLHSLSQADGRFAFAHVAPKPFRFRVQAPGYGTVVQGVDASQAGEVRFELEPSQVLRGRVVDHETKLPVVGATVASASDQFGLDELQWHTKADADGRFSWDAAPPGPALYGVVAEGYALMTGIPLRAGGEEHILRIKKVAIRNFSGTVVDGGDGNPLDGFKVLLEDAEGGHSRRIATGRDGRFDIEYEDHGFEQEFKLIVRADGYAPAATETRLFAAGDLTFAFKLQRSAGWAGVVLAPSGQPAVGAMVVQCTPETAAYATMRVPGKISVDGIDPDKRTITDDAGRLQLAPILNAKSVLVVHESGCAKVPIEKLSTEPVRLNAWGRVEGTLRIGQNLGASQKVMIYNGSLGQPADSPAVPFSYETKADANGRFTFDFVPPGMQVVCRIINPHEGKAGPIGLSHKVKVGVPQNEIAHVEIGGKGRGVTGRLMTDAAARKIDWTLDVHYLEASDHEIAPIVAATNRSLLAEWMAANELRQSRYYFSCREDGSFRLDDVPGGTYRLVATVSEIRSDTAQRRLPDSRPIGWLKRDVTVPETDGAAEDFTVNLGELRIERQPR